MQSQWWSRTQVQPESLQISVDLVLLDPLCRMSRVDQRRSQAPLNLDPELTSDGWSSVLSLRTAVGRYSPGARATRRYLLRLQILTGIFRPVPSPVLTGTQQEV